jgi:hypothetical protein
LSQNVIPTQAAIDEDKAAMAGQEVAFARAIAAEHATLPHDPRTGLTRQDIEDDLEAAAARKKRIDEERAAKAGAEVAHVCSPRAPPVLYKGYRLILAFGYYSF